jgi:hypothetical protein
MKKKLVADGKTIPLPELYGGGDLRADRHDTYPPDRCMIPLKQRPGVLPLLYRIEMADG